MLYPWQESQWQNIRQQMKQQRLPHALILTGASGLGKLSLANHIAATVLCESNQNQEICGRCHSCQLFIAGSHPDHNLIQPEEAGKQIKIEQIRQLKDKQELTPTVAKWKTVIISPAENMNINANNSLLKLLEEPQKNTVLILISAKPEQLPITILSRCQKVSLSPPPKENAIHWLQQQSAVAKQADDILPLLKLAKGAPLAVLNMLETDLINKLQQLDDDFESLLQGQANPVLLAKDWLHYDLLMVFNYLQHNIKTRILKIQEQDSNCDSAQYWTIYDCIIATIKLISSSNNINKTLLIEQFMVSVIKRDLNKTSVLNR
ncbi:MAG: DNA polymerase III subunit delta' [Gammaproteobacteria bacterium]|nr:DNA polymerase III subunit delta' [Gammaproteobacteria bacterium]